MCPYTRLSNGIVITPVAVRQNLISAHLACSTLAKRSGAGAGTNQSNNPLQGQTLESQLSDAQAALTQALSDRERLLLEVRKYDPTFTLWASLSFTSEPAALLLRLRISDGMYRAECQEPARLSKSMSRHWTCLKRRRIRAVALDHFLLAISHCSWDYKRAL